MKLKVIATIILSVFLTSCEMKNQSHNFDYDSLKGVDANMNGIRDDIDAYIEKHFSDAKHKAVISSFSKTVQESLLIDKTDLESVRALSDKQGDAIYCMYRVLPDDVGLDSGNIVKRITRLTTNTESRLLAFDAYKQALDSTAFPAPNEEACQGMLG